MSYYKQGDFVVWSRKYAIYCGKVVEVLHPSLNLRVHEYSNVEKKPYYLPDGKTPVTKIVKTGRLIKVKEL